MVENRKKRPPLITPRMLKVSFAFAAIFVLMFFFKTWCGVQCIRTGYEIASEKQRRQEMNNLKKYLIIELAHLKSPENLAKVAEERFDLVVPKPEQMVIIP